MQPRAAWSPIVCWRHGTTMKVCCGYQQVTSTAGMYDDEPSPQKLQSQPPHFASAADMTFSGICASRSCSCESRLRPRAPAQQLAFMPHEQPQQIHRKPSHRQARYSHETALSTPGQVSVQALVPRKGTRQHAWPVLNRHPAQDDSVHTWATLLGPEQNALEQKKPCGRAGARACR